MGLSVSVSVGPGAGKHGENPLQDENSEIW